MPSFFDEVDSNGIVEEHIQEVLRLEHSQAVEVLKNYTAIQKDLVERVARFPAGKFSSQHMKGVLAQVQGAIAAINEELSGGTLEASREAAELGVVDLVDELKAFDQEFLGAVTPINLQAAVLAKDVSKFLVTKYQTNLDDYGTDLLNQIGNGLLSAAIGDASHEEVVRRISEFFTAEQWKLRRIVRTELHNIYNEGKIRGMQDLAQDTIPDLKKTLMHPMDGRTGKDSIYAAQLNLVAEIDEPFVYEWRRKIREFMAPPDRPNDRSILVPYREEWGAARGGAFVPGTFPLAS